MPIAPLLKPKYTTTCPANIYDTFVVVMLPEGVTADRGTPLDPPPAIGFDKDDAIVKLAMLLKTMALTPEHFMLQMEGYTLGIKHVRVAEVDGVSHTQLRRADPTGTHKSIYSRLVEVYPEVEGNAPVQVPVVMVEEEDGGPRTMTMANSGSSNATGPVHPADKPKKERKVTIVYQGGGDKTDQMLQQIKQLTAESIPLGGLVITMGKNGPKMLKTASAKTDEEEVQDMLDGNEAEPVTTHAREEVARPVAREEAPRPTLQTRTVSGDQFEKVAPKSVKASVIPVLDADGFEMSMDQSEAAAMVDQEMGSTGTSEVEFDVAPAVAGISPDDGASSLAGSTEVAGHRVKKTSIVRKDRGGSRPVKAK